jgi:hypothetical protein
MDEDNPWPIFAGPPHLLKLINQLISLKEPFTAITIPSPLSVNGETLKTVMEFESSFLAKYSDILLKWAYWRTYLDESEAISLILKFVYKIIMAVRETLAETEFTMLLASMISVMIRFKGMHFQLIGDLLLCIFNISMVYKETSLVFWVNLLIKEQNMTNLPVNEILKLLTTYYSEALSQHLPTLARSPKVLKN